jgi:hypothetical protein
MLAARAARWGLVGLGLGARTLVFSGCFCFSSILRASRGSGSVSGAPPHHDAVQVRVDVSNLKCKGDASGTWRSPHLESGSSSRRLKLAECSGPALASRKWAVATLQEAGPRKWPVAGQRLAGATVGTGQTKLETKALGLIRGWNLICVCLCATVWGNPRMSSTMVL